MVVGEQAAVSLQHLLEQRLGLRIFPLGNERVRLPLQGSGRQVRDSIVVRQRGHPPQRPQPPLFVDRVEVLRPLNSPPQCEQFLRPRNRLLPAIGLLSLADLLV